MSKEHGEFSRESGDVGFLAGVVDVLSDNLVMLCDRGDKMLPLNK